jgi:uncharacterized surface protein with fasciclin (FAS1) repeats
MKWYLLPAVATALIALNAFAADTVKVGGKAMFPSRTIVENAVNSADHTTLVAAVKAADLVETLSSPGPFTVFAPVNAAFRDLPKGTVENLLKPENKKTLQAVLTYHVVPGRVTYNGLERLIKMGGGKATLKTAQGGTLIARKNGDTNIELEDAKGNTANLTVTNVYQSNGVIHVIDRVMMP